MGMLRVLRNRDFRRLWAAGLLSLCGAQVSRMGLILYLFHDTDDVAALATLLVCETLPGSLIAPFSGAVIDRFNKRHILIVSDLFRKLLLLVIILHPTTLVTYCMVMLYSLATVFFEPARTASVPLIVGRDELRDANGLQQSAFNMVLIVGPLIGAELYVRAGLSATLWANASTFVVSALLLLNVRMREARPEEEGETPARGFRLTTTAADALKGWRYLVRHRLVLHIISLLFVSLLCVGLWLPLVPFFIRDFLGGSDRILGLQFSALGVGGVVGGLAAPVLLGRLGKGAVLFWALLVEGLVMVVYSLTPDVLLSVLITFMWGMIGATTAVQSNSIMQERVSESFLGRIFSISRQSESIALVIALGLAVALHQRLGANQILVAFGLLYFAVVAASAVTRGGREMVQVR